MARVDGRRRLLTISTAPTLMTLGNLLCGFMAVFWASRSGGEVVLGQFRPLTIAAGLVFTGMVFDALDGMVARLARSSSGFGAQLDSMADMVTFGVAPAFLAVQVNDVGLPFFATDAGDSYFGRLVLLTAAAYAACCGLRLARFTVEAAAASTAGPDDRPDPGPGPGRDSDAPTRRARRPDAFIGLPSPGAAGLIASLVLVHLAILDSWPTSPAARLGPLVIVACMFLAALAMVSQLPYPHAVKRGLRRRRPFVPLALGVVAVILLLAAPRLSAAAAFAAYALLGPLTATRRPKPRYTCAESDRPTHHATGG